MFSVGKKIEELVRDDPNLTTLKLFKKKLLTEHFSKLLIALKTNTHLKELELKQCYIDDRQTQQLAQVLESNRGLKKLNLSHNTIDDDGAKALGTALKENKVLEELDLGWNQIGCEGLNPFAEMLSINGSLKVLKLNNNNRLLHASIIRMIESAIALEHLDLRYNNFYMHSMVLYIIPALLKNTTLKRLDLCESDQAHTYYPELLEKTKEISSDMQEYTIYCDDYKKNLKETLYNTLWTFPTALCDMIKEYSKCPSRTEVKEWQENRKKNNIASVPQTIFFNKNDREESDLGSTNKNLKPTIK